VPHPDAPRPRVPRNWITIGTSAVATGVALAIVMALVSPRAPEIAPAPDSVAAAALPGPPAATEPPRTAVLAPGKKAAAKPLALPRPRIATNLGAKAAMPATKSPVTRARTAAPATKQAAKQPVAAKPSTAAGAKLATRTVPQTMKRPAASPAARTARPVSKIAAKPATPAKRKAVASIAPKPAAPKKPPATR